MSNHHANTHNKPPELKVGQFVFSKKGVSRFDLRDPYHLAVSSTWPRFTLGMIAIYLAINLLFAGLFLLQPGSVNNVRPRSISDAFFFSAETLATVGYGVMSPRTIYGHIIATAEIMTGMAFTAVMTGLIFVRFSKPRAKMIYAKHCVISQWRNHPALMIRFGNGRLNLLNNVTVKLTLAFMESEGSDKRIRRVQYLPLERDTLPFMALTWTLLHTIDHQSPLDGLTAKQMHDADCHILLEVQARDPALGADVYDSHNYTSAEVLFGMRFAENMRTDGLTRITADIADIDHVELESHDGTPQDAFVGKQH
jgi:inward rectifier potassium channel